MLLSAGVDYAEYLRQVELAMGVGASGILGGRAFWKEYFLQQGSGARSRFAATTARSGWPKSMPSFARKQRPGLPATASARTNWPRSGLPKAGTCDTAQRGPSSGGFRQRPAAPGEVY